MRTHRAVLALLAEGEVRAVSGLLSEAGFEVTAAAGSVAGALEAVKRHLPDLLISDAILPGGDGLTLARRVMATGLERYPDVVLLIPRGLQLPEADADVQALEKPLTGDALRRALDAFAQDPARLPPERVRRLYGLMDRLGIPPHPGRELLFRAAALAWRDRRRLSNLRDRVYPEAARPFGGTPAQAERAIRHVIEVAWRRGDIEAQNELFGDTIDARRGRPTCGEMIAQLADILRWEG